MLFLRLMQAKLDNFKENAIKTKIILLLQQNIIESFFKHSYRSRMIVNRRGFCITKSGMC